MPAALLFYTLTATALTAGEVPVVGEVVFESGFETAAQREAWNQAPFAAWEAAAGGTVLAVTVPPERAGGGNLIGLKLDLAKYRGCQLLLSARARAEGVTKPTANYLGVKYMLHFQTPSQQYWGNQNDVHGTFDWRDLKFTVTLPTDIGAADLNLGLQACSGRVWFDDLKIVVAKLPRPPRPAPQPNPPPAFKGHNLPRLRGVMSPNAFKAEDLRFLAEEWNANAIRWQLTRNWGVAGTDRDLDEYDRWITAEMADLDQVLAAAQRYGIKVVIDLHSPPGGRLPGMDLAIFHEARYQDHFVKVWQRLAAHFKGHPAVWGYDLVNEPTQTEPSREGVGDYLSAQVRAARAIREIDPTTPIFIESNQWDSAEGFKDLDPVDLTNVIYQVHMYVPGEFTHQGVHGSKTGVVYPGPIHGVEWNKERLRGVLAPVREFQLAYNVHIYVGEFSAIRWGPGAAAYLRDCLELFEEYGWDWTYHAYREWDGWSLEHGSDPEDHAPTREPSDRLQVVRGWFAKNRRALP
ncbi:MAG: cellulase family glycosylhydrolase [Fimbriimonadaceae bacterium]|nr:cellulase family glycosylhydrolase [Fimbriimonadaceae bacterium]